MQIKFLLFVSFALAAQTPENPGVYEVLYDVFQLTPEQYTKIKSNNAAYGDWVLEKLKRMRAVQDEIAVESKRETIIPGALGPRYAEIEVIGRQLIERRAAVVAENRKVLTEAQREKFKIFDDALKLQEVMGAAGSINLFEQKDPCFYLSSPTKGILVHFCSGTIPYVGLP